MTQLVSTLRLLKNELLPRYASRLRKPIKVIWGAGEYRRRKLEAGRAAAGEGRDLETLRRFGHLTINPPADLLAQVCAEGAQRLAQSKRLDQRADKAFFSNLIRKGELNLSSPFLRLALDEQILRTAAAYLDCAPFLESVELLHSKPVENLSRSQLWHMDRTDQSILKIFIYCLDVGNENGPFSFLDAEDSAKVPENLPHYLTDADMARFVPLDRIHRNMGPAGTTFLIDTSRCYHFGSRCIQPRLAYIAYFTSGFGYYPRETRWQPGAGSDNLSPLQRLALGLPV